MIITIDGNKYEAAKGETILNVCKRNDIPIPTLCYDERLKAKGGCRLCLVEVNGKLETSCTVPAKEDLKITTNNERVRKARHHILDLLFSNHPNDCLNCQKSGSCKLQDYCYEYDVKDGSFRFGEHKDYDVDTSSKFYNYDPNKCIMCGNCIEVCQKLQCSNAIGYKDRGFGVTMAAEGGGTIEESPCVSCGNCVAVCPTGALTTKESGFRYWEVERTRTTCPYCGVGCQFDLLTKGDKVVGVEPAFGTVPNDGLLCVKGKNAYNYINHESRLKTPLIKRNGKFEEATWDEALTLIVSKIQKYKEESGSDSIAGFSCAKSTNEDNYLFQKMMRAVIGTNNVDHCARLCHSSTVAGLATTLGSGAMTNSIGETEFNDLLFITGANSTENHPVLGTMMKRAKNRGAKILVADPRRIELADWADLYLQIRPGTNIALINGMCHVIIRDGLQDMAYIEANTEGYEELKENVKEYTPEVAAKITGVPAEDIEKAAHMYAEASCAGIYYAMGVTQFATGTHGVMSMSNIAMLTGNIGKENAGVNPLRGQNNVQGACDMGCLPSDLPGYQKVIKPAVREQFEKYWGVPIPDKVGLTLPEVFNEILKDNVRMLWVFGENPVVSDADSNHVRHALEHCEFVVVNDLFMTETTEYADVILPGASYAEKNGTFTNTERRVQRVRKAVEPRGDSRPDWKIFMEVMNRMGYNKTYRNESQIFDEIAEVTPSYHGMSYERIDKVGLQWPCPTKDHPGTKVMHKNKPARGKGLFVAVKYEDPVEMPDAEYPYLLTTGRNLYHFHTRTMTGKTEGINEISGESYVEISPSTASRLKVVTGDAVRLKSRRGEVVAEARVKDNLEDDVVFMPFHYAWGANTLTIAAVDPIAKIPEFKVCGISIEKEVV